MKPRDRRCSGPAIADRFYTASKVEIHSWLQEEIKSSHDFEEIVGESEPLRITLSKVQHVAKTDAIGVQQDIGGGFLSEEPVDVHREKDIQGVLENLVQAVRREEAVLARNQRVHSRQSLRR